MNWRKRPLGVTIPTWLGEASRHGSWGLGFSFRSVTYADHRSGWSGTQLRVQFLRWNWSVGVLRWQTPLHKPLASWLSLREQIQDTHENHWLRWEEKQADQELQQRMHELLILKRIRDSREG